MLNRPLYDLLCGVLPDPIKVIHENTPAVVRVQPAVARSPLEDAAPEIEVQRWGEVYRTNCPRCRDKHQRLFISHCSGQTFVQDDIPYRLGWVYVCHNEHCGLRELHSLDIGGLPALAEADSPVLSLSHIVLQESCKLPKKYIYVDDPDMPDQFKTYLVDRGFDLVELASTYKVGYACAGDTWFEPTPKQKADGIFSRTAKEDRIIIPILNRRQLCGFQARRIDDIKEYKYLNQPDGLQKSQMLYNLDTALMQKEVCIVEGVTDVWKVGVRGVGTFGRDASEWQRWALSMGWKFDGMGLIIPDRNDPLAGPAADDLKAFLDAKEAFPRGCHILELAPGTDPGAYAAKDIREFIEGSIQYYDAIR